jgi:hypothetical protein
VDSGAPITSFGETTAKKLFGERQFGSVIIQGLLLIEFKLITF